MTNKSKYQLICGLEIHAELKNQSKMFCSCKNDPFGADKPNIHTCPVCLGMPGGLPVANKKAIEWTIKLGLALNCKINLFSKFDRKHYFYPDLPKGYQISQYDIPFCEGGWVETSQGRVEITRVHLEEDTGKLLHKEIDGKKVSLVDFNRGGVPLIEIVTEPDIKSANQAKEFGKKLRQIIRYLEIGNCNMEQGGMRLEANVSLTSDGKLPDYKTEVKNINSFRFLEQAIEYETERQTKLLDKGESPVQETRGFDATKGSTFSQRVKETAADYRYFPDPDLPPIRFAKEDIERLQVGLPELPEQIQARWQEEYGLDQEVTNLLVTTSSRSELLEEVWQIAQKNETNLKKITVWIINNLELLTPTTWADQIFGKYMDQTKTTQIDESELIKVVKQVFENNPQETARYKAGEKKLLGFFIGQVKKIVGNKADAKQIIDAID